MCVGADISVENEVEMDIEELLFFTSVALTNIFSTPNFLWHIPTQEHFECLWNCDHLQQTAYSMSLSK